MTDAKRQDLAGPVGPWRGAAPLAASGVAVVCFVAVLALAWMSVGTLLLIFAGVLLGVFLDGLTRGLGHVLPLPRGLRLTVASLAVAVAVVGFASYGGATIVQQGRDLGTTIKDQAGTVTAWLSERGIDVPNLAPQGDQKGAGGEAGQKEGGLGGFASGLLKGGGSIVSEAGSVLGPAAAIILGLFDALGNFLVIAFLGLAFAADPRSYRDGTLRFVPPKRRWRAAQVLDGAGETLRHWLFGQLIIMAAIFYQQRATLTRLPDHALR